MKLAQLSLTAEEIDTLVYCMDLRSEFTPEMIRLAKRLNESRMTLGHECLSNSYTVVLDRCLRDAEEVSNG